MTTHPPSRSAWLAACAACLLAGCASVPPDDTLAAARQRLATDEAALLQLPGTAARTAPGDDRATPPTAEAAAARARRTDALLAAPLQADGARQLALLNSPALQALLAEAWQRDLLLADGARPRLPRLGLERITQADAPTEFTASLGLGLAELVLWPQRQRAAAGRTQANRLQLAQQVLLHQQQVRTQWLRAVAAGELAQYQAQVADAAETAAELARRMQKAGHFSRLQQLREEALALDAQTRARRAAHQALAEREGLVRALGLDSAQAARLQLPPRLPDLPAEAAGPTAPTAAPTTAAPTATPTAPDTAATAAPPPERRLDLALARQQLQALQAEPGARSSAVDLDLGLSRIRQGDERRNGVSLELGLASDGGQLRSQARQAAQRAAEARLQALQRQAESQARERGAARHQAWALAHQARQTLVPLKAALSDETLLRYNGMLMSVFDLLAAAREQVGAVITALEAQRDFWLADAAWQASLDGVPTAEPGPAGAEPGTAPAARSSADSH